MSTTHATPSDPVQRMIDLRLDAIDRALMGLLPRNDRLKTVAEVETRIRELAAADSAVEANLQAQAEHARLDDLPRLGEGAEGAQFSSALQPSASAAGRMTSPSRTKRSSLALSSGISGIVALLLLFASPIAYMVIATLGANDVVDEAIAMLLLGTLVAAVAIGGTAAVALGVAALVRLNRRADRLVGHGWAITGLCTGPLPMLAGGLIGLIGGLQFLGMESVSSVEVQTASVPPGPMIAPAYGQPPANVPASSSYPSPYGQPPANASAPQWYPSSSPFVPPPPSIPPSYAPTDYPPSAAEHVDSRPSQLQPDQPVIDDAPAARPETPASLPNAPATREPASSPPPFGAD
jgi:hypothetical protein